MIMKKVYVVIPAYNEERRLPDLIKKLRVYIPLSQIVVVDDGSRVKVADFLPKRVWVARHRVNLGKGMALRTGCDLAIRLGAETIILMDADGQHDPKEIPAFITQLKKGYQVVFGARRVDKRMPVWRKGGNAFLNKVVRVLFGLNLCDVWCGYRAFRAKVYEKIVWDSSDYSSDVEMAVAVGLNKLKHTEHFVGTIYHDKGSTTGTTLHDGIKLLIELFFWRLQKI